MLFDPYLYFGVLPHKRLLEQILSHEVNEQLQAVNSLPLGHHLTFKLSPPPKL